MRQRESVSRTEAGRFLARITLLALTVAAAGEIAFAGTFTVSNINASGAGSLTDAISQANAIAGPHTINVTATGMLSLTVPLVLTQSMTINGPVATPPVFSIDGASATQLIQVSASAAGPMTLNNISLTHGGRSSGKGGAIDVPAGRTLNLNNCVVAASSTFGTSSEDLFFGAGGAVSTLGTLNIQSCVFSSNSATGPGGAIYAGPTATLTIAGSLFAANTALSTFAGAIDCDSTTSVTITDSTFSTNQSGSRGAGAIAFSSSQAVIRGSTFTGNTTLGAGGAMVTNAASGQSIGIENSTISENSADFAGAFYAQAGTTDLRNVTITANSANRGAGVYNPGSSTIQLRNSIVAGNTAASQSSPDCSGAVSSGGYNLIENTDGCTGLAATDLTGTSPGLGALRNNGGPTQTHLPFGSSPAFEGGNPAGCVGLNGSSLTVDQRGQSRPFGARCDVGAVEIQSGAPVIPPKRRAAHHG